MGYKYDQNPFPETYRPPAQSEHPEEQIPPPERGPPPPLPPRATLDSPEDDSPDALPPYTETAPTYHSQPLTNSWTAQDPRSSSTQSLVPHDDPHTDGDGNRTDGKRTLLLVYIHGFMGNETSFQSFPAHVHNLVTVKLEGSHIVHTKIYPKYKSRKAIEFARDAFSDWLRPHEDPDTDVVLLGHSMGGLLSAEVALLEGHRIMGTINFDTPFLGMHPGVIASGLGSLFRPAPDSPAPKPSETGNGSQGFTRTSTNECIQPSASSSYFGSEATGPTLMPTESSSTTTTTLPLSTTLDLPHKDPNFDPPFVNDVRLPQRTGWSNAWHFLNKHSDDLRKATQSYVKSHLEFGGAMADFNGLKNRYGKIRALEDVQPPERTRFVNYYTASTGRPKKPKESSPLASRTQPGQVSGDPSPKVLQTHEASLDTLDGHPTDPNPRISKEETEDEEIAEEDAQDHDKTFLTASKEITDDECAMSDASQAMDHLHPAPVTDDEREEEVDNLDKQAALQPIKSNATSDSSASKAPSIASTNPPPSRAAPTLPPIPTAPEEPALFDPARYTDKDTRKLAEKEHSRQVKAYKQAVKDRDKAIADRRKLVEKREKNAAKEREKVGKAEEKERIKAEQRGMEKGERERAKAEREEQKEKEKERLKAEKERAKAESDRLKKACQPESAPKAEGEGDAGAAGTEAIEEKAKRDKKFCMLPSKEKGRIDGCWVRVFMPGVDEVGAHCGLFFVDGERYQWFVSDVAERIKEWVEQRGRD
ncbi:MAG: hypothetical protein ALECFALPRED_002085 [Alectoria fallacina]|uniref:DUF676 domain-containing protein n=1 Tax=Alectoria fallacina TaxID=1903189 RepID=A0A8H3FAI9_9LECA|nr:MAG: hypothetical protein ALECFALPRED_002085 [Alectoria fallacina]